MPGSDFDVNTPSPDDGHEAIRVAVVQAIEDLRYTADDMDGSYSLLDTIFYLLDGALTTVDELTERVAALEAATPPTNPLPEVAP